MIRCDPRLHALQIAITDHEHQVFGPEGMSCNEMRVSSTTREICERAERRSRPLRYAARDSTVAIPRRFNVPSPSPIRLSLEALTIMASVPDARGEDKTAYAFVPITSYPKVHNMKPQRQKKKGRKHHESVSGDKKRGPDHAPRKRSERRILASRPVCLVSGIP